MNNIQEHVEKVREYIETYRHTASLGLHKQSLDIIEQQQGKIGDMQLNINDWEDECSALQRRYDDLDKYALETMNLLHEASHKVEQQQREIEAIQVGKSVLSAQFIDEVDRHAKVTAKYLRLSAESAEKDREIERLNGRIESLEKGWDFNG